MRRNPIKDPEYEAVWGLRNDPLLANAILESMLGGQTTNVGRVSIYRLIAKLYLETESHDARLAYATTAARRGEAGALLFMKALAWYKDHDVTSSASSSRLQSHISAFKNVEWGRAACEACEPLQD